MEAEKQHDYFEQNIPWEHKKMLDSGELKTADDGIKFLEFAKDNGYALDPFIIRGAKRITEEEEIQEEHKRHEDYLAQIKNRYAKEVVNED